ncbi:MAG TPA: prolyl oligopeptidase family serine peptidase [Gemmatimonadales bacterium]|nr:prolyl oligopeptidase family serine peptidase [Gemmatimonadales bacterium]
MATRDEGRGTRPARSRPAYPPAPPGDAVELLHGDAIPDPYRWLEDGDAAATREWTARQNALTRAWLDALPERAAIHARLETLLAVGTLSCPTPLGDGARYLYERREGRQNQPVLYVREGLHGADRVAVDPNTLDAAGTTALDWYHASADGRLLAYGLSEHGSERSVLHLLDLEHLTPLPDRIPDTRACSLAWLPDGSGFYYTRYPAADEVPAGEEQYHRVVCFHRLGDDPAQDPLVFRPAEKEHWPGVALSRDGRWLVLVVARTFDQTDLYVRDLADADGDFVAVAKDLAASFEGTVVRDRLYLRTNLEAPTYGLYEVDPTHPAREGWRTLVAPRPDAVLEGFAVTRGQLVLTWLEHATSRLELAALDGAARRTVALPTLGTLYGLGAEDDGDELLYGFTSYTVPPSVYRVDLAAAAAATGAPSPAATPLPPVPSALWDRVEADVEPERFEVRQVRYPSKDSTPISMFLVHPRGAPRDGANPVYLTGYGGFNVSMTPGFSRSLLLWLEQGGVVAVPNLRGGGEYGETWHQQGMLARKQNTFDDFVAAAEWLVAEGWTRPERLAAAGGSNGGLLMGAVLTQRPDLFRAVVVQVPLLDMLRYHRFLIARLWIPEYGDPEDAEQFRWLRAYSPYHHVREGVAYPAVLLATAESDTRVDPMHARKMAARLQAATASDRPVLLRLEERAGHGAGKPLAKVLDELTDTWTFVFHELGVTMLEAPTAPTAPA